jgi:hypothetical protein
MNAAAAKLIGQASFPGARLVLFGSFFIGQIERGIGIEADRIALIEGPIGHRGSCTDSKFLKFRIDAIIRIGASDGIQKNHQAMGSSGLINFALQLHTACGGFPVNTSEAIAIGVIADTNHARRIFKETARGATFTKRVAGREAKASQGENEGIDQNKLAIGDLHLAIEKPKGVTAAEGCGSKGMDAASRTADRITPCNAFIPGRAKETFQHTAILAGIRAELLALDKESAGNTILYLKPGKREKFGILNGEGERDDLAERNLLFIEVALIF